MKNFVFISPNFPSNYWLFCRALKNNGVNVLGIGDAPYDELSQEQKDKIQSKANEINDSYDSWIGSLKPTTPNIEAYITSSQTAVKRFREFIAITMTESSSQTNPTDKPIRTKRIKIIECVPVASKKIKTKEDVEKVLSAIKDKLIRELGDNDEINLD